MTYRNKCVEISPQSVPTIDFSNHTHLNSMHLAKLAASLYRSAFHRSGDGERTILAAAPAATPKKEPLTIDKILTGTKYSLILYTV